MNAKRKLDQLFQSARNAPPPQPSEDFAASVMREVGRGVPTAPKVESEMISLFDYFGNLFPRLAMASVLMITLCIGADYCLSNFVQRDFSTSAAELSELWLFAVK